MTPPKVFEAPVIAALGDLDDLDDLDAWVLCPQTRPWDAMDPRPTTSGGWRSATAGLLFGRGRGTTIDGSRQPN